MGAFLVCLAGTLATPVRMIFSLLPGDLRWRYGRAVVAGIRQPYADALSQTTDPAQWGFWFGRYVIPNVPTVYPMWTFTNGDLRPHMLSTPLLVLAAALGAAYCWTPAELRRLVGGVTVGLAVALGGATLVAPYFLGGLAPSRGVGLFPPRSPLVPFVLAYGLFVGSFVLYFGTRAVDALPGSLDGPSPARRSVASSQPACSSSGTPPPSPRRASSDGRGRASSASTRRSGSAPDGAPSRGGPTSCCRGGPGCGASCIGSSAG